MIFEKAIRNALSGSLKIRQREAKMPYEKKIEVKGKKAEVAVEYSKFRIDRLVGERWMDQWGLEAKIVGGEIIVTTNKVPMTASLRIVELVKNDDPNAGYCDCGGMCVDHEPRIPYWLDGASSNYQINFTE